MRLSAKPHPDGLPARVLNVVHLGTSTHDYLELEGDGDSGLPLVAVAQNSAADGNGTPPLTPGAPAFVERVKQARQG